MRVMSARPLEPVIAATLVASFGVGATLAAAGALRSDLILAGAGAAVLAACLVGLVATDWVDGTAVTILALPLPALLSTETIRVAAVAPITALVVFAWLLRSALRNGPRPTTLPVRSLFALLLAFTLSGVFATHPAASARELLNIVVLFAFLVLVTDRFVEAAARVEQAMLLLAGVAALTATAAVLEMLGVIPGVFPRAGTTLYRAALGFGQPNGLGLFLALCVPLVVHFAGAARPAVRIAARCAVPVMLLGLAATFSRGSWLAVLAGSVVLLFARAGRTALRIWLGALLFAVAFDVVSGGALRDTVARTIGDWVIEQRLALQLAGVMMFLDRPWLGVGPGGYAENLDRYGAQISQLFDYLPTPHNAYVQMAAETGAIGLAAFIVFLAVALLLAVRGARAATGPRERSLRVALLWSFATACAAGMVVWPFAHGTGQALMLVAAGIFATCARPAAAESA